MIPSYRFNIRSWKVFHGLISFKEEKWAFILEWEKAKNLSDFTEMIPDELIEEPFE